MKKPKPWDICGNLEYENRLGLFNNKAAKFDKGLQCILTIFLLLVFLFMFVLITTAGILYILRK